MKPLRLTVACFAALLAFFSLTAASAFARNLYVTASGTNLLSVFDTQTGAAGTPTLVGGAPEAVAIAPNGKTAYVANKATKTVSVVDTASSRVLQTITVGEEPDAIAVTPDGKKVYVANNSGGGVVSVINTATNAAKEITGVGAFARGVAITPDGKSAYVASEGSKGVAVIDIASDTVRKASIETVPGVEHPGATGVAVSPDGKSVYVTNQLTNSVSVINTETEAVKQIPVGLKPLGIAITPDGKAAYVSNNGAATVQVINTAAGTATVFVRVGKEPRGVAVDPNGKFVYVANQGDNNVSIIETATNTAGIDGIAVGTGMSPVGIAVTPNQAPAAELTFSGNPIHAGDSVVFDGSGTEDDEGMVASYDFSFGDGKGQIGNSPTATHAFATAGTFTVTLKTTDASGCSAPDTFLFGGQTAFCNGLPTAQITRQVTVVPAPPEPPKKVIPPTTSPVKPPKPAGLRVAVPCPKGTQPKGCQFTVQAVSGKPTKHRKATALSAVARAKAKAGGSATVSLLPKPAFAKKLAAAKTILVKETVTAKGKTSTRYLRLRVVR